MFYQTPIMKVQDEFNYPLIKWKLQVFLNIFFNSSPFWKKMSLTSRREGEGSLYVITCGKNGGKVCCVKRVEEVKKGLN